MCTKCDVPHPLKRISREERECYRIKPAEITVERHIRYTYVCEELGTGVITAPAPPTILPKTNASPSVVAYFVAKKFDFSMPIHRSCRELAQSGAEISTASACRWVNTVGGEDVVPVVNLLNDCIFDASLMQIDETYLQVLKSHKAPTTSHFMVVRTGGKPGERIVLYNYIPSRNKAALRELLIGPDGPFQGKLVTDGLGLYDDICTDLKILHFGCWQHARQYCYKADKVSEAPGSRSLTHTALVDYIRPIFKVEEKIEVLRAEREQRGEVLPSDLVLQMRQERSKPLVQAFKGWVDKLMPGTAPHSPLGRALSYTASQWTKLERFLDHDVPMHNNRPEQQNKHFAVGRKNWWHCYGEVGARASANLLSLVRTCRANGVVAFDYLVHIFELLPAARSVEDFEALLPWNVKPALEQRRRERDGAARMSISCRSPKASSSSPATLPAPVAG
jgi:transposase